MTFVNRVVESVLSYHLAYDELFDILIESWSLITVSNVPAAWADSIEVC